MQQVYMSLQGQALAPEQCTACCGTGCSCQVAGSGCSTPRQQQLPPKQQLLRRSDVDFSYSLQAAQQQQQQQQQQQYQGQWQY
jgi:hypothetical protein